MYFSLILPLVKRKVATMLKELEYLGKKIRAVRKTKGLTQERLAELADLHPTFVSEVETGKANYTIATLFAICKALGVKANEVVEAAYFGEDKEGLRKKLDYLISSLRKKDEVTRRKVVTILDAILKE
jgi:transcriptional regulator with XRE-family HTH domain